MQKNQKRKKFLGKKIRKNTGPKKKERVAFCQEKKKSSLWKRLILAELHAGVQISNKEFTVKSKLLNMLRRIQDFEKGGWNKWAAKGRPTWGWSGGMLPLEILKFKSSEMRFPAL